MCRHPESYIPEFSKQCSDCWLENINDYNDICICGDININTLKHKLNSVKNYLIQINDQSHTNIIFVPTRENNLRGTLIDQFLIHVQNKLLSIMSFCQIY